MNMSRKVNDMNLIDPEGAQRLAQLLRLLGIPRRLQILSLLLEGSFSVGEIKARTGIGQPVLSQQLGDLRRGGIIMPRRQSQMIYYSIVNESVARSVRTMLSLLEPGRAFASTVDIASPGVPRRMSAHSAHGNLPS